MVGLFLKILGVFFLGFIVFSLIYLKQNFRNVPSCSIGGFDNSSNVDIKLAYNEDTNYIEPYKSRIEEDFKRVKDIISLLPLVGRTSISLSAKSRYGYNFDSVTPGQLGQYYNAPNYIFLNMEDQSSLEHLILHEVGGHYLSVRQNLNNLKAYLTSEQVKDIENSEINLIKSIKRYKEEKDFSKSARDIKVNLSTNFKISWDELVDAANDYPSDIWRHPSSYTQFKDKIDLSAVEKRADDELYAEFTAYLLRAQKRGLFDCMYEHPVLKIFKEIKKGSS